MVFGLLVILVISMVAFRWYGFFEGAGIRQPLEFSHKVHTEMVQCEECHTGVKKSAFAGMPGIKICTGCHGDTPVTESPEEKKLINYVKAGQEIRWRRLYQNPFHVYFSHARHVSVGNVECEKCHGPIGKASKPPRRALVAIDMSDCISCHKEKKVDISCVVCHK